MRQKAPCGAEAAAPRRKRPGRAEGFHPHETGCDKGIGAAKLRRKNGGGNNIWIFHPLFNREARFLSHKESESRIFINKSKGSRRPEAALRRPAARPRKAGARGGPLLHGTQVKLHGTQMKLRGMQVRPTSRAKFRASGPGLPAGRPPGARPEPDARAKMGEAPLAVSETLRKFVPVRQPT